MEMKVNFQKYQKFAYFTADIFRQVMVWLPAMWRAKFDHF